jgi:hypothetical protein
MQRREEGVGGWEQGGPNTGFMRFVGSEEGDS